MQNDGVEHVNHDGEEHRRHRIALAQPLGMHDRRPRQSVDEDAGARGGKQNGDPFPPAWAESMVAQDLEEEWPGNRVERAGNVKLE